MEDAVYGPLLDAKKLPLGFVNHIHAADDLIDAVRGIWHAILCVGSRRWSMPRSEKSLRDARIANFPGCHERVPSAKLKTVDVPSTGSEDNARARRAFAEKRVRWKGR